MGSSQTKYKKVGPKDNIPKCSVCKHFLNENFLQCNVCTTTVHYNCMVVDQKGRTICSYCSRWDTLVPVIK